MFGALAVAATTQAQGAGVQRKVFECSLGVKNVVVTSLGNSLIYNYGIPGNTELSFVGNASKANIFHSGSFGTLDYIKQIRFTNAGFSYLIIEEGLTKEFTSGKHGRARLVVRQGPKLVGQHRCIRGGFLNIDLISDLPEDPSED